MNIRFRTPGSTQPAVQPAQAAMRDERPRRLPVIRVLLLLLALAAGGWAVWRWINVLYVNAHALVISEISEMHAPRRSLVGDVKIRRGDSVKKGDLLFILSAPDAVADLRSAESEVASARARLEGGGLPIGTPPAADAASRLNEAYELARLEVQKQTALHDQKHDRYESLVTLAKMDAATETETRQARTEMELSLVALRQAEIALEAASQRKSLASHADPEALKSAVTAAEARLDRTRREAGPTEYRALFDGIVQELNLSKGATVESGILLVAIASKERITIDAYVPASRAAGVKAGSPARIYPPGRATPVYGRVMSSASAESTVPKALQAYMPDTPTAAIIRIEPAEVAGFTPGGVVRVRIDP